MTGPSSQGALPVTRSRRPSFGRNILASYGGQASVVITGFVLTPVLLASLGPSMYGVLILVLSIQGLAGLMDLGVTATVVRYVATHEANDEPAARNRVLSTLTMLHLVVGSATGVLLALVAVAGLPLFGLSQGDLASARDALLVAAVGVAVNLVLGVPGHLIVGLRRFDVSNAVIVTQTIVSAVVTVVALGAGAGPAVLVAINVTVVALGHLVRWWYGRRLLPDLRISPRLADRATLSRVGAYGGWMFLLGAGRTFFKNADAVLIGLFLPVAAVGSYSLGFRPASIISYIAAPLVAVFVPTAARFQARSETTSLRRLLLDGSRLSFALTLAGAIWLWTFGDLLIEAWIGPDQGDAVTVMFVFVGVFLVGAFQFPASALLQGIGAVRGFATVVLVQYVANLALSVLLITRIGILGAAIGSLLPALIAEGLLIPRLACRAVGVSYMKMLRVVLPGALVAGAITAAALIALRRVLVIPDLTTALMSAVVAAALFLGAFAVVGMSGTERRVVRARLSAALPWSPPLETPEDQRVPSRPRTDPTTTVVIPTIGRPGLLARCITGVMAGDRQPDRIVVCDQSADDRTADVVGSLGSAVPTTYLRLPVAAVSAARNAGAEAAESELVIFIDDDCVASPSWLGALLDAYVRAADREVVAAVAGAVLPLVSGAGGVPVSSRTSTTERTFRAAGGALDRAEWAPWDVGTGGNLLVRRAALVAVGGFDTSLGPGTPGVAAEDVDLLYRLARVGVLVYAPRAQVYHPATTRAKRLRSRVRYGRGMGAMLARRGRDGDAAATPLTWLYLRHQLAQALRTGSWGPLESGLTLLGAAPPLCGELVRRLRGRGRG